MIKFSQNYDFGLNHRLLLKKNYFLSVLGVFSEIREQGGEKIGALRIGKRKEIESTISPTGRRKYSLSVARSCFFGVSGLDDTPTISSQREFPPIKDGGTNRA